MITIVTYSQVPPSNRAIALGNFDGLHRGHQCVILPILTYKSKNIKTAVVTFIPHPQEFFTGEKKKLLTPLEEKAKILGQLGVEELILLPFDRELASLTPQQFVADVLHREIGAVFVSVGEDFRFGYRRQGKAKDLENIAKRYGIEVNITPEQSIVLHGEKRRISSSFIRECLLEGRVEIAREMLGREYQIQGRVIEGKKLGRQIGFPTANLEIPPDKFLPRYGVYQAMVELPFPLNGRGQAHNNNSSIVAVVNIGKRPTVDGETVTIEVHIPNWYGDLYGEILNVRLMHFIRDEKKFTSLEELKKQIANDCKTVLDNYFLMSPS
ncbi:MAG: bifunctional riboflavin kinase/FAD synthetase [Geminocystis sp.]|nr:bifunctional riboflavin kinase/FAD synthetase [Geminocystis sp.]MCX8077266.1 bifunctional riboflavin kinase/FAD synthetase [Geminocystis sp.]MDW8463322.1 bifunctional riboflavin kinase/FAD synthetase [Geminocystis sp.]